MLQNFFTITLRSFVRNWNHTLINAFGLSVGIASCIIIFLIVHFELSFDEFHSKRERIYRVLHDNETASGVEQSTVTPYPFANAFRLDFADVPLVTEFHFQEESQVAIADEKIKVKNIIFADSLFFDVFDFGVVEGNPRADLAHPGKVFLTESLAKQLLTAGRPRHINLGNKLELEVAGILKDPPAESHIRFNMVVSMPSLSQDYLAFPTTEWEMNMAGFTYIVLPPAIEPAQIDQRLQPFASKYHTRARSKHRYHLQPLSDVHFNGVYQNATGSSNVNRSNLMVLGFLGAFILLVACINFVNLSTALAVKKSREVGVRKTLGASRTQLARQFVLEAFLLTLASTFAALLIVEMAVAPVSAFLEKNITLDLSGDPTVLLFLAMLIVVATITSGAYPAMVLSRFSPVTALKNKFSNRGSSGASARRYLVMFQFLITQVLIMGTLVVADQMEYFHSKPLGFNRDAIVNVNVPKPSLEQRETLQSLLEAVPGVDAVSFSLGAPTSNNNFNTSFYMTERGKADTYDTEIKPVDKNYMITYGIELAAGRWFTENEERSMQLPKEQRIFSFVVNEALVKAMGYSSNEEIIGKKITIGIGQIDAEIVGVAKDFHTKSFHNLVDPTVLMLLPQFYYDAGIRFQGQQVKTVLEGVKGAYARVYPDYLLEYSFLDDLLNGLYKEEQRTFGLMKVFALLSIAISCLGLFGLVSFMTQQRVREVGIRKVFGASVQNIVYLFSRGFIGVIVVSFVAAVPLAWYLMNIWLEGFAYRTPIEISVFVVAVGLTTFIALLTVSYQSMRAALANPVDSLRSE